MQMEQVRFKLTDEQMDTVKGLPNVAHAVVWLFEQALGGDVIEIADQRGGNIEPNAVALPYEQAQEILNWYLEKGPVSHRAEIGMLWVDKGPSAYEEDQS